MPPLDTAGGGLLAIVALVAYLFGSIPFGVVMARAFGLGDLRQVGSGNIGATNVLRTGNRLAAALTLALDGAKGAIAVLLGRALFAEDAAQIAGLAAFLGHLFPIYLGLKGGKGVATFLGVLLALAWPVGLACCAVWLVVAAITRLSSLSALMASGLAPLWTFFLGEGQMFFITILLALLVYIRHAANISRLRAGTEPKIGAKSEPAPPT